MLSIQQLGLEVLNHNPQKFYVFGGKEYGVKSRYIEELESFYGAKSEVNSVMDLLNMFSVKRLIPLKPTLYVVRYDNDFVSKLNKDVADKIKKCNIIGTVVCVYESDSSLNKMEKYLPNNTASIDPINEVFVEKYLKQEFPNMNPAIISVCIKSSENYGQARIMCKSLSYVDDSKIPYDDLSSLSKLIGFQDISTDTQIRLGVAGRDFKYLINTLDKYNGDYNNILYTILQTMIELDKLLDNGRTQSDIRQYVKNWTREDVYYMFNHTYNELKKLRSSSSYDIENCLIYLFGLLGFQRIPSLNSMKVN